MPSREIAQFTHDLNGHSKAIQSVLPVGMDSRRFMRTLVNTVSTHPQSDRLLNADRQSLFSACQKAAGDGLLIDGRESTLIVYRDSKKRTEVVNYIPMVQGLVKLARNSGEIAKIVAELVYSNDSFQYRPGIDEQPVHDPQWFGERGEPIGAYAIVATKDGENIVSVMPKNRIMAIAKSGRNADQYDPKKGTNFQEWWKKCAIKNVLKYSPKSTYLESAISFDNQSFDNQSKHNYEVPSHQEPETIEKDITDSPTVEEIKTMVCDASEAIEKATSKKQLISLQKQISKLPIEDQESLVIKWNKRAVKIKSDEEKPALKKKTRPASDSGLEEHSINAPLTGEILDDIA